MLSSTCEKSSTKQRRKTNKHKSGNTLCKSLLVTFFSREIKENPILVLAIVLKRQPAIDLTKTMEEETMPANNGGKLYFCLTKDSYELARDVERNSTFYCTDGKVKANSVALSTWSSRIRYDIVAPCDM